MIQMRLRVGKAVESALPSLKPGAPINAISAAQAMENAVDCAKIVGFGPQEFAARMQGLLENRAR